MEKVNLYFRAFCGAPANATGSDPRVLADELTTQAGNGWRLLTSFLVLFL